MHAPINEVIAVGIWVGIIGYALARAAGWCDQAEDAGAVNRRGQGR